MNEELSRDTRMEQLPVAEIKPKKGFSIVWLIPLLALVIGGWLVFKAWSEKGPVVTITLKSAEGLEAGKTKVKYKDVDIGQVEEISLSDDISKVIVKLQMQDGAESFLTDRTRFWVVRARVAAGKVSGLGTIFSGAYIGIDPVKDGKPTLEFVGLEEPPLVTTDTPGRLFGLKAEGLGSLDIGSPVYYREIEVGQVVQYGFDDTGQAVDIKIFIQAPHDRQVTDNTRFWNASGIDMSLDATGIKVDTQSLISIMLGGIAFDDGPDPLAAEPAAENTAFPLYANKDETTKENYTNQNYFLIYFNQSVRGLSVGSPVEFRGIKLGEVIDIHAVVDDKTRVFRIPVTVAIKPERIHGFGSAAKSTRDDLRNYVDRGFRAVLRSGNLVTGQLFVDLDFFPDDPPRELTFEGPYPVIPSRATEIKEITESIAEIVKKFETIPIDEIGKDLHRTILATTATMNRIERLAGQFDAETVPAMTEALESLRSTLADLEAGLGSDSPVNFQLREALGDFSEMTRSLRGLTDYLERHPESLIFGKKGDQP